MDRQTVKLLVVSLAVFALSALAAYLFFGRSASPASDTRNAPATGAASPGARPNAENQQRPANSNSDSFFSEVFGAEGANVEGERTESRAAALARVTVRLALAALLTAILAFRPRKFSVLFKRNLFVAQTQILLAVVASALMMIVGDSAARAFGIFAAASLVRFRTNIKDPKEITVLLVSLAVGLATGVGRWELAAVLSLFVLGLLWALEYREPEMVFRSLDLKVRTRNLDKTHEAIKGVLQQHNFGSELRALNREDEKEPFGNIVFHVRISPLVSTDKLSEDILSSDDNNIDSIEWSQQKNSANIYQ
ncbi:MAG TPA: DUF4956 domain-containing protein [Pyrinomonadaceae bacterium]|jgi:uncharacterized membrane protein YhiD involved in acid resistance|nr:DUF4956 domain-containing protein [Pyrinomonadaceae bacterium]